MKSGSKSRVRVKFELQSSGFYRVITIWLPSGFRVFRVFILPTYECFECQVLGQVRVIPPGFWGFGYPTSSLKEAELWSSLSLCDASKADLKLQTIAKSTGPPNLQYSQNQALAQTAKPS